MLIQPQPFPVFLSNIVNLCQVWFGLCLMNRLAIYTTAVLKALGLSNAEWIFKAQYIWLSCKSILNFSKKLLSLVFYNNLLPSLRGKGGLRSKCYFSKFYNMLWHYSSSFQNGITFHSSNPTSFDFMTNLVRFYIGKYRQIW